MKRFMKKFACAAMALAMSVGVAAISASALLGDLNDSGKMNSADARILLRYSAKLEELDEAHLALADYNCDGKVNSSDARILLRAAAKVEKLESYNNYYFEMVEQDGMSGSFGRLDGTVFAEASAMGLNMGMVFLPNGDFIFIDHEGSRYAPLTVADQKALSDLMAAQGEEGFDFKEMINEAFETLPDMPTPVKLLDDGYVKTAGEWNGEAAEVYSKDDTTYYFKGRTLLAIVSGDTQATYTNFTEDPEPYIYAYKSNGYKEVDFIELMMSMANDSGLF